MRLSSPSLLAASLLLSLQTDLVLAAPKISTVGAKFFYENGTQFFIKGATHPTWPLHVLSPTHSLQASPTSSSPMIPS